MICETVRARSLRLKIEDMKFTLAEHLELFYQVKRFIEINGSVA
jgi:hypothetical protein